MPPFSNVSSSPMSRDERARIVSNLFHEGRRLRPFLNRFFALMGLSTLIAVLGLLADSTAVVIGAMVVAPLMAPVLGISAALVMDWPRRALRSFAVSVGGTLFAVALAALSSRILLTLRSAPIDGELPGEILSRTQPNLFDLGVALVAGAAGAYAQMRRQAGDALIGVAVAVALVPPLGVIGITLQLGEWDMAIGSSLLFLANVSGITAAGALTFVWCGFLPAQQMESGLPVGRTIRGLVAFGGLVLTPLILTSAYDQNRPLGDAAATEAVAEVLNTMMPNGAEVITIAVESSPDGRVVNVTASDSGQDIDVASVAEELSEVLDEGVDLKITTLETSSSEAVVDEPEDADGEGVVKAATKAAAASIGLGGGDDDD